MGSSHSYPFFSPNFNYVCVTSLWDKDITFLDKKSIIGCLHDVPHTSEGIHFSEDGNSFSFVSDQGAAVYNSTDGKPIAHIPASRDRIQHIYLSKRGKLGLIIGLDSKSLCFSIIDFEKRVQYPDGKKQLMIGYEIREITGGNVSEVYPQCLLTSGNNAYVINYQTGDYKSMNGNMRQVIPHIHSSMMKVYSYPSDFQRTIATTVSVRGAFCAIPSPSKKSLVIYNLISGTLHMKLKECRGIITAVDFSYDGKYCIVGDSCGFVGIYNTLTGSEVVFNNYEEFSSMTDYRLERMFLYRDNGIVVDLRKGENYFHDISHSIALLSFSKDDYSCLIYSYATGALSIISIQDELASIQTVKKIDSYICTAKTLHNETHFITGVINASKQAKICNINTGSCIDRIGVKGPVFSIAVSEDESLAVIGMFGKAVLVNLNNLKQKPIVLKFQNGAVKTCAFRSDNMYCVTADSSGIARIYAVKTGKLVNEICVCDQSIVGIQWDFPYGFVDRNGAIEIWKLNDVSPDATAKMIRRIYNIEGVNISNCDFTNAIIRPEVSQLLRQYGANL